MGVTKTFIQKQVKKRFKDDADKIDSSSYSHDSNLSNLMDDIGHIPKTQSEIDSRGAHEAHMLFEERKRTQENVFDMFKRMKSPTYQKDTTKDDISILDLNKMLSEKAKAREEAVKYSQRQQNIFHSKFEEIKKERELETEKYNKEKELKKEYWKTWKPELKETAKQSLTESFDTSKARNAVKGFKVKWW